VILQWDRRCSRSAGETDRGAVAGNGGCMALAKKQLKKNKWQGTSAKKSGAKQRSQTKRKSKASPTEESLEAVKEESVNADPEGKATVDGKSALLESANLAVAASSDKIANKLAEQATEGNNASTRILVELVTLYNQQGKRNSKRLSALLSQLESDSEWTKPEAKANQQDSEGST
jgi:hypothetical protein